MDKAFASLPRGEREMVLKQAGMDALLNPEAMKTRESAEQYIAQRCAFYTGSKEALEKLRAAGRAESLLRTITVATESTKMDVQDAQDLAARIFNFSEKTPPTKLIFPEAEEVKELANITR